MSTKNYDFQEDDYNTPELLDDYELEEHGKYLKELNSKVSTAINLYDKELAARLHRK